MTQEQYQQRVAPYIERYISARKAKCTRTAEARLRDWAKLYASYKECAYEVAYKSVQRIAEAFYKARR